MKISDFYQISLKILVYLTDFSPLFLFLMLAVESDQYYKSEGLYAKFHENKFLEK